MRELNQLGVERASRFLRDVGVSNFARDGWAPPVAEAIRIYLDTVAEQEGETK